MNELNRVDGDCGWKRQPLLDVWVDDLTLDALIDRLDRDGGVVFTLNPDHLTKMRDDVVFRDAYRQADYITADSFYVFRALTFLGRPVAEIICGSDLVPTYLRRHAKDGGTKVFLLGAQPGVADRARSRLNARLGRDIVVGSHGPSMNVTTDPVETAEVIRMIRDSGANVLMVGFGAPKQEVWIARHRHELPEIRTFMGVGATIDYEAGAVRRAPRWLRGWGLEWTYRVVTEPRRYLMRYLRSMRFFWWVLQERLKGGSGLPEESRRHAPRSP